MNLQVTNNSTKTDLIQLAEKAVEEMSAFGNIIDSIDILYKMEFLIENIKKNPDFIEIVRNKVAQYGKQVVHVSGTKIELAEVGTKYDFSVCNDSELNELIKQSELIEQKLKARKDFLKTIPDEGLQMVTNEGELIVIYKPNKTSTSSFKITLAK